MEKRKLWRIEGHPSLPRAFLTSCIVQRTRENEDGTPCPAPQDTEDARIWSEEHKM